MNPDARTPADAESASKPPVRISLERWLLGVSVVVSALIFGDSVVTSFGSLAPTAETESESPVSPPSYFSLDDRKLTGEEFRSRARELDYDLVRRVRDRDPDPKSLPARHDARRKWKENVESIESQLEAAGPAPPGTILGGRRQELERLREDAPPGY